jgi:hypothetical protein
VASGWVSMGTNPDNVWETDVDTSNRVPDAPSPGQFRLNGGTAIAVGELIYEPGIEILGIVSDPDGHQVRLEVRIAPVGSSLSEATPTSSDLMAGGGTASVPLSPGSGLYRWEARAVDDHGDATPWAGFGDNEEGAADVEIRWMTVHEAEQYRPQGLTAIPLGGRVYDNETDVIFQAVVTSLGVGSVRLEVDVAAVGAPFANAATAWSGWVSSGQTASILLTLPVEGAFRWQYRGVNDVDHMTTWTAFGGNPETAADFELRAWGGSQNDAGGVGCAGRAVGDATPIWLLILPLLLGSCRIGSDSP